MVKKSIMFNYKNNNKISKTTIGGRPPFANSANAANARNEAEEAEKRRLKQLELEMLERQAQTAAQKTISEDTVMMCMSCNYDITFLNSNVYLEDEKEFVSVKEEIFHHKGEPKEPTFLMRCPLGDHFYCNNCFNRNVDMQIRDGEKDKISFNNPPLYIRCCIPNCKGKYSNDQVQRLVSKETYQNLIKLISRINDDFDICSLTLEKGDIDNALLVCPRCFLGPISKQNCPSMFTHHGELKNGTRTNNACSRCSYLSSDMDDFINFTPGDKSCNMCNIIEREQLGYIDNKVYPVKEAVADFDHYFRWPDYFQPNANSWFAGDERRRLFVKNIFDNRHETFTKESNDSKSYSDISGELDPRIKYSKFLNIALRCGRARNSFIIFLINRLRTSSKLFTPEKVIDYLLDKEPMSSYLGPCCIAISAAEFQISNGLGRHPFYELVNPSQRLNMELFPSVNAGIFALAHFIADPDHAVENYKKSASHETASPTNPLVEYDDEGKQAIIKKLTLDYQIRDETKTDDEILALETLANKSAEENEHIEIQCQKNIEAAIAKNQNERKKALIKALEAINEPDAQQKVRLGREAFDHALEAYRMHQKIIYNELYIQADALSKLII
jgi:hypothetical protein